jgi:hypothetical protein
MSATIPTRQRVGQASPPTWIKSELAKLVEKAPDGSDWAHEIKFDGYRMHARLEPAATTARYSSRKASATLDVASRGQVMGQQFGLAFDEIGTSQRRNTKVRLTHRWSKGDSNPRSNLRGAHNRRSFGRASERGIPRLGDRGGTVKARARGIHCFAQS